MVKYKSAQLDDIFRALADTTRRDIVNSLSAGSATASRLAAPFEMSLPAISKHLKVLERAGLIQRTISGRSHHFCLNAAQLNAAADWIKDQQIFWEQRLGNLERYLDSQQGESDV